MDYRDFLQTHYESEADVTVSLFSALKRVGVPCGAVRPMKAALSAPETLARNMVMSVAHPLAGSVRMIGSPLKLADTPVVTPTAPPLLGEHSAEVLGELLGFGATQIAAAAGQT